MFDALVQLGSISVMSEGQGHKSNFTVTR